MIHRKRPSSHQRAATKFDDVWSSWSIYYLCCWRPSSRSKSPVFSPLLAVSPPCFSSLKAPLLKIVLGAHLFKTKLRWQLKKIWSFLRTVKRAAPLADQSHLCSLCCLQSLHLDSAPKKRLCQKVILGAHFFKTKQRWQLREIWSFLKIVKRATPQADQRNLWSLLLHLASAP